MARILVVNQDPWTQRMLSAVLVHAGHSIELVSEGWEALLQPGHAQPDLVIADYDLSSPEERGFVETLRSRPGLARTPVLYLTRAGRPERAHPLFDHFLSREFRVEELESVVAKLVGSVKVTTPVPSSGAKAITPTPPPPVREERRRAVLTGTLDHFALSSVLIVLELERKSGVLWLSGGMRQGRISLRDGRVIRAEAPGPARGALAVYELLTWTDGRFDFNAGEVEGDDEIGSSTSHLLMEGARLVDERNHAKQRRN